MTAEVINRCKYYLPCGLCDLSHERCKQDKPVYDSVKCDHDWRFYERRTINMEETIIFKCLNCGKFKYVHKSLEE